MNFSILGTQTSTQITILIPHTLTAEGTIAYILKVILDNIKGYLTDENNESITDEFGNLIDFDNYSFYPSMPLSLWRIRINGVWVEKQIVFLLRESNAT